MELLERGLVARLGRFHGWRPFACYFKLFVRRPIAETVVVVVMPIGACARVTDHPVFAIPPLAALLVQGDVDVEELGKVFVAIAHS